jgi:hypothetical protein
MSQWAHAGHDYAPECAFYQRSVSALATVTDVLVVVADQRPRSQSGPLSSDRRTAPIGQLDWVERRARNA